MPVLETDKESSYDLLFEYEALLDHTFPGGPRQKRKAAPSLRGGLPSFQCVDTRWVPQVSILRPGKPQTSTNLRLSFSSYAAQRRSTAPIRCDIVTSYPRRVGKEC